MNKFPNEILGMVDTQIDCKFEC